MAQKIYFITAIIVLICFAQIEAKAQNEILTQFHFSSLGLRSSSTGATEINIDNLPLSVEAGLPKLPFATQYIVLPNGSDLANVEYTPQDTQFEKVENIAINYAMNPLSWHKNPPILLNTTMSPLSQIKTYPQSPLQYSIQTWHGVKIAIINFYPVQVDVINNSISFVPQAEVRLTLKNIAPTTRPLRFHEYLDILALVDNNENLHSYSISTTEQDDYDYLIISNNELISYTGPESIAVFQAALNQRGLISKVISTETITRSQTGIDLQDKIRNYINQEYRTHAIKYVLLLGDGDSSGRGNIIPARMLWSRVRGYTGSWSWIEKEIAADFYYSCLDGSFNSNNNSHWGEVNDGDNGKDVDLLPEVTVGRWPVTTVERLKNYVRKTLYIYSHTQPKQVGLFGEVLFSELNLYGSGYMGQLVGQCSDHGFTTNGYNSQWQMNTYYDEQKRWTDDDAIALINTNKISMLNHIGHSDTYSNMKMNAFYSVKELKNERPYFFYTQGCYPGDFTARGCFIEELLGQPFGPVASIANASYGLGPEDPDPQGSKAPGASQMLHRQFINHVFGEGVKEFGRAHQLSKVKFVNYSQTQEIRWVYWSATYFGDPSLVFQF